MTGNETPDEGRARTALQAAERARESARRTGRRWARRYLLYFGAASAGSVIPVWLLSPWVSQSWWGLWYVALIALMGIWLRRQPVRALPKVLMAVLIVGWSIVFGTTMAIGPEFPVAYPIGAVVGFGVWAAGAWWAGRPARGRDNG